MRVGTPDQALTDHLDKALNYEIRVVAGNANHPLAEEIARDLKVKITQAEIKRFADGECYVSLKENVRGKDVFIVQPTSPPVNDHLMELLLIIDTLKRASAKRITAVIPYYGYSRQDRKNAPRVPISARLVADLISTAGAHRVLAFELHAGQIQGFFNIPVDHLFAIPVFADHLIKMGLNKDVVVVSPDAGVWSGRVLWPSVSTLRLPSSTSAGARQMWRTSCTSLGTFATATA